MPRDEPLGYSDLFPGENFATVLRTAHRLLPPPLNVIHSDLYEINLEMQLPITL
ncbi:hypothetical protein V6x_52150 [Gimesia chilikensis]|uniref:Uncharacterized protein n=1 Tax=Gimesia chilikensis TaxID=2605989 RepID=A0A517WJP2_9PLAN|nr:hypothetical protein V6x_52150 [Gimesia chilikensis]